MSTIHGRGPSDISFRRLLATRRMLADMPAGVRSQYARHQLGIYESIERKFGKGKGCTPAFRRVLRRAAR